MKYLILIIAYLLFASCGSKKDEDSPGWQIYQMWRYRDDAYLDAYNGWTLTTCVSYNKRHMKQWELKTEQPDTIREAYIKIAKEYIKHCKQSKDTIIYLQ